MISPNTINLWMVVEGWWWLWKAGGGCGRLVDVETTAFVTVSSCKKNR